MATKIFIFSFEREFKTTSRSLLQNFNISFISWHILTRNIKLSAILHISYVTSGSRNFIFLHETMINMRP